MNKELKKLKMSYQYYKKLNRLNEFNIKYPDGFDKLKKVSFISLDFNINKYNSERLKNVICIEKYLNK